MNIDAAQRALERAQRRADRPGLSDNQRRVALNDVDRARKDLRRAEEKMARKLEDQGYEVSGKARPRRSGWFG